MNKNSKTAVDVRRAIAIEITPSQATVVAVASDDGLANATVQVSNGQCAEALTDLSEPRAAEHLADVLKPLIQENSLHGQPVSILLSGAYCSTRVLRGDEDAIRRGMLDLEKLKQHYMGIGRGEKALASVVRSIDARQDRATVAVAVDSTLEVLIEVSQRLGIELATVEPAAISLARLAGHLGVDREQPIAMISADSAGTDIAISFLGDVLLHHRLRAPLETEGESERISQNLCLMAQYAARFSQEARENHMPVYVVSRGNAEDQLEQHLAAHPDIELRALDAEEALPTWQWQTPEECGTPWAATGGALRTFLANDAAPAPDMVHNLTGTSHLKLLQARRRMILPLVAAGVIGVAVGFAALWEGAAAAALHENLSRFDPVEQQLNDTKLALMQAKTFNENTEVIGTQISGIYWQIELDLLAKCKPAGVWLKRVSLRRDGTLAITGNSKNDSAIYEFKDWLNQAPPFENVEITSTRAGPRTEFELECDIRGRGGY